MREGSRDSFLQWPTCDDTKSGDIHFCLCVTINKQIKTKMPLSRKEGGGGGREEEEKEEEERRRVEEGGKGQPHDLWQFYGQVLGARLSANVTETVCFRIENQSGI